MVKKTGASRTKITGEIGPRALAWASVGLLLACSILAGLDLVRERDRAIEVGDAAMQDLARVVDALHQADEARIHALLARIRIELRSVGSFARLGAADQGAADPASARQRDTLLRRALEGTDDVRSIDLLVAGQEGLARVRVEPEAQPMPELEDASERDARAKALWYSDVVQRAVEANGRRVARSAVARAGAEVGGAATVQTVLALHDAEEVVQGVLIATIDLVPLASRLGSLSSPSTRFALITPDGQAIGTPSHAPKGPIASHLREDGLVSEPRPEIAASDGLRSLVVPASPSEVGAPELAFWLECDAPPSLVVAAAGSPWLAVLAVSTLLSATLFARDRDRTRTPEGVDWKTSVSSRASSAAPSARAAQALDARAEAVGTRPADPAPARGESPVCSERFVLRDWLADVRGCLEREAATRGLTLDLRCERTLPREIRQDPLWLGGLLVSLGREALDATSASRVALEVTEAGEDRLRFELDAGDTVLEAETGMEVIAGRLGATLEEVGRGRISVVVPASLA